MQISETVDTSAYYWKGFLTRKENRSVQCDQNLSLVLNNSNIVESHVYRHDWKKELLILKNTWMQTGYNKLLPFVLYLVCVVKGLDPLFCAHIVYLSAILVSNGYHLYFVRSIINVQMKMTFKERIVTLGFLLFWYINWNWKNDGIILSWSSQVPIFYCILCISVIISIYIY